MRASESFFGGKCKNVRFDVKSWPKMGVALCRWGARVRVRARVGACGVRRLIHPQMHTHIRHRHTHTHARTHSLVHSRTHAKNS